MDTTRPYETVQELARALRLPAAWVKREAQAGRLPCIQVGRRLMFCREDVIQSLSSRAHIEADAR